MTKKLARRMPDFWVEHLRWKALRKEFDIQRLIADYVIERWPDGSLHMTWWGRMCGRSYPKVLKQEYDIDVKRD